MPLKLREKSKDNQNFSWPWAKEFWKPDSTDRVKELAKAGALIAAEIDRILTKSSKYLKD